jgi:AraC family transcriptional regulator
MKQSVKCIKDFPPSAGIRYDEARWKRQHGESLVIINCFSAAIYYPEHWTPLSFKFAFTGKEFYKLRNTTYAVSDSHFLVLNQGSEYESFILSDTITESLTVNYTQENINQLFSYATLNNLQLLDEPFPHRRQSLDFLEKLYSYNESINKPVQVLKKLIAMKQPDDFALTEILYKLLAQVHELNHVSEREINAVDAGKYSTRKELYTRLSIAKDYLHSCYDKNITLELLAETCFMNPFYLLRQFKKQFGTTPHQYLTAIRLQQAEKLVRHSDKRISDIMNESGFEDLTSFGKLFKKKFGMPPAHYRQRGNQK